MPAHVESLHELAEQANAAPKVRRRGRSRYMRKSLIYMAAQTPEEYATCKPRDKWEEIAKNLIDRAVKGTKADSIMAYSIIRDTLGEKIGPDQAKDSDGRTRPQNSVTVINDAVPFADRAAN